jgi:hypothetical protein
MINHGYAEALSTGQMISSGTNSPPAEVSIARKLILDYLEIQ